MDRELVIVLDFGGQYNQLIARRVRECNVYCEVHPYTLSLDKIREMNPKGIIFTGGPNSVYGEDSPRCPKEIFEMGIPILGICYGSQLMSYMLGGSVKTAPVSEYGKTEVAVDTESALFKNVSPSTICWMSHTDYIEKAPEKFKITAHTPVCPVAGMENAEKKLYAVQFHPEVMHTQEGTKMLSNFVYDICGCTGDWKMDSFVETTIHQIREKVGDGKVLCALSGGVDSSVAAVLLSKAVGKQLTCVFVDHGFYVFDQFLPLCTRKYLSRRRKIPVFLDFDRIAPRSALRIEFSIRAKDRIQFFEDLRAFIDIAVARILGKHLLFVLDLVLCARDFQLRILHIEIQHSRRLHILARVLFLLRLQSRIEIQDQLQLQTKVHFFQRQFDISGLIIHDLHVHIFDIFIQVDPVDDTAKPHLFGNFIQLFFVRIRLFSVFL